MSQRDRRRVLFLLLCFASILTVVLFGFFAGRQSRPSTVSPSAAQAPTSDLKTPSPGNDARAPSDQPPAAPLSEKSASADGQEDVHAEALKIRTEPSSKKNIQSRVYFRSNALGDSFGKLAVAPIDALDDVRYSSQLSCERVHFASGNGVCLTKGIMPGQNGRDKIGPAFRSWLMDPTGYSALMFNEQLRPGWNIKLSGIPSRVRVSPSGRIAAITVFLSGHSYAALSFSTQTTIIDVLSGKALTDLETFSVTRNGEVFKSSDFNFWGVTFEHNENRFYATLWSTGKTYLVECDLAKHSANVIYDGVECPSLSPDQTRIAFKKRTGFIGGPITWRISLLDLKFLTERPLGETRSIDDQVEWKDDAHILYALSENEKGTGASADIWILSTAADGSPHLWLRGASSPAVVPGMF